MHGLSQSVVQAQQNLEAGIIFIALHGFFVAFVAAELKHIVNHGGLVFDSAGAITTIITNYK